MKPVDAKQRIGAVAMALSVTFSIVWALSNYAYAKPSVGELSPAAMTTPKSCS